MTNKHYEQLDIQPLEAMEAWLTKEQFVGFCLGNCIKYLARYNMQGTQGKGGLKDLEKADRYLLTLMRAIEKETHA